MKTLKDPETGLYALATDNNKEVTEYIYSRILDANQFGLYKVYKNEGIAEECGFIDSTGKEIVPVNWFFESYDEDTNFDENGYCFVLESDDNHGDFDSLDSLYNALYDTKGNVVFKAPNLFSHQTAFGNYVLDLVTERAETRYGLFVPKTLKKVEPIYTDIGYYNIYGYALVKKQDYCGIIDAKGNEVLRCAYRKIVGLPPTKEELRADDFSQYKEFLENSDAYNGLFIVQSFNGLLAISNFNFPNPTNLSFKYLATGDLTNDGYLPVCDKKTHKWGVIDTICRVIVPFKYNSDYEALDELKNYAWVAKFEKPTYDTGKRRELC